MRSSMLRPNTHLVAPVNNPEFLVRPAVVEPPARGESDCAKERKKTTEDRGEVITRIIEGDSNRVDSDQDISAIERVALDPVKKG